MLAISWLFCLLVQIGTVANVAYSWRTVQFSNSLESVKRLERLRVILVFLQACAMFTSWVLCYFAFEACALDNIELGFFLGIATAMALHCIVQWGLFTALWGMDFNQPRQPMYAIIGVITFETTLWTQAGLLALLWVVCIFATFFESAKILALG